MILGVEKETEQHHKERSHTSPCSKVKAYFMFIFCLCIEVKSRMIMYLVDYDHDDIYCFSCIYTKVHSFKRCALCQQSESQDDFS